MIKKLIERIKSLFTREPKQVIPDPMPEVIQTVVNRYRHPVLNNRHKYTGNSARAIKRLSKTLFEITGPWNVLRKDK